MKVKTLENLVEVFQDKRQMKKCKVVRQGPRCITAAYLLTNKIKWDFQLHPIIQVRILYKYHSISIVTMNMTLTLLVKKLAK